MAAFKQVPQLPKPDNTVIAKGEMTKQSQDIKPHNNSAKSGNNSAESLFSRFKKIKNFEIYVAVALILVMIAIYMTTFNGGGNSGSSATGWQRSNEDVYARELESKLVNTLSGIKGAGKVQAMVTVTGSATLEVAYNIDEKSITQQGSGGSATTTTTIVRTPVIINGRDGPQPLILLEIKPKLKGVVIVASGAADPAVRLQLLRAVQTLIADDSVRIEIFTGK